MSTYRRIANVFVLRGITLHVNTLAGGCHVGSNFFFPHTFSLSKFVAVMSKPHGGHEAICKCRFYWSDGLTHDCSAKDASQLVERTPFVTIGEHTVLDGNWGEQLHAHFRFFSVNKTLVRKHSIRIGVLYVQCWLITMFNHVLRIFQNLFPSTLRNGRVH